MQKHRTRTIIIYALLALSVIYIYPTIGWMLKSDDERQTIINQINEEDRVYQKPDMWQDMKKSIRRWAMCDPSMIINLGLDLQGGIHMVLGLDMDSVDPNLLQEMHDSGMSDTDIVKEFQTTALRTIERRVNEFEAKEPVIQTYGDRQIQVQLPGEKNIERAKRLITQSAFLTFHLMVQQQESDDIFKAIENKFPKQFLPYLRMAEPGAPYELDEQYFDNIRQVVADARNVPGLLPENRDIFFSKKPQQWDQNKRYRVYVLEKEPLMTGANLTRAAARPDPNSPEGFYHILFAMDTAGGRKFGEVTESNVGRNLAIVVDNVVESAPRINDKITTSGVITGAFTPDEARDLAIALNSGAMPAKIHEEFTGVVNASLGADSVRKGVWSAIVGLILVVVFMVAYYRVAGVVANIGLVVNSIFILALMAYFNCTLTLPGIAGLVLTMGMAVDANVLIYERIREEVRNGRSLLASIANGFDRAQITILDANLTTLIAAAVLMQFGTGPIEGFAITLSIGVVASVFAALVVCRAMFDFLAKRNMLGKLEMMSFFKPDINVHFMDKRKKAMTGSSIAILIGLIMFIARLGAENNIFGVDFTTGTNMVVNLHGDTPVTDAQVREKLIAAGFTEAVVQEFEDASTETANRFMIRIPNIDTATPSPAQPAGDAASPAPEAEAAPAAADGEITVSGTVQNALASLTPTPDDPLGVEMERVETVGPAVGAQLKWDALKSMFFALLFIVAYVAFRFELKFSVGAVVALIHDVLFTVGLFAILQMQISLTVVAALLTIVGYSINDTIVVFDRIRENLRLYRGRSLSYAQIMDISINQTLSRTILTSATTLFVCLALWLFGGSVISDFAFALLAGITVGTYSSIFIASPIALFIHNWQVARQHKHEAETGPSSRRKRVSTKRKETASDNPEEDGASA